MGGRRRLSVTRRITLFTGVLVTVLCALLAVVILAAVQFLTNGYVKDELVGVGGRVVAEVESGRLVRPITPGPVGDIQVVDQNGRVVAATAALRGRPAMASLRPAGYHGIADGTVCGDAFARRGCHIVVAQWARGPDGPRVVYAAAPRVPFWTHPALAALVVGGSALLVGVTQWLAVRGARTAMAPVRAIRAELDEINATCPQRRVPVPPGGDDIHDLAVGVNRTLARLEAALEQQRRFATDASHDLRTPITAMRAEAEDALLSPESTTVPVLARVMLRSLDRLQALVGDLLTLARLDADLRGAEDRVDLADLVEAELRHRPPPDERLTCSLQAGVVVVGDRLRLGRLLANLLDNAERHAANAISVIVRLDAATPAFPDGTAVLEVNDDGAGVAPDKRELVFQRFTRLDAARSRDAGGSGLGLPIARQIAEASGGTLRIEDSELGARFVVRLPAAPPDGGGLGRPDAGHR
ncbi:HAMP domain-containing sensor histidine kinase [Microbispora corallina]|uniref:histidine kinase n=1 Tax=Microbispora corallina TaxID=83302 RepID=A0ABQ4G1X6_9ACTN|nr:HAMP domain-containing sensor histidine kinase [Microbispora corallina]GIH40983.1 two-component sensor histidine kinase [Microbispora corallina]